MTNRPVQSAELATLLGQSVSKALELGAETVSVELLLSLLLETASNQTLLAACLPAANISSLHEELKALLREQARAQVKRPWYRELLPRIFTWQMPVFSQQAERALDEMILYAVRASQAEFGCNDMLVAIATVDSAAAGALNNCGLSRFVLVSHLSHGLGFGNPFPDDGQQHEGTDVRLFLLNDNYTTAEFVIEVLTSVLAIGTDEATKIISEINADGRADCGVYPLAAARSKLQEIELKAKHNHHPLRGILELA
jgi:ATP-dependent Clp protease adaptor protein ClpS